MAPPSLSFTPLKPVNYLDDILFQIEDSFTWDHAKVSELQKRLFTEAFAHHYRTNEDYRHYCQRLGVTPESYRFDPSRPGIPLVTATQFKLRTVLSTSPQSIVKTCTSSGTQGSMSKVLRDETTLCRFLGSVQTCIDQALHLDDAYCLHLGPSKDEAGDLWFSYVMSATDMIFPTENFVVEGHFAPQEVLRRLQRVRPQYENVLLIGAPIMFLHLLEYMQEQRLKIEGSERIIIITAGGWKRFSGSSIPRPEFEQSLATHFVGLPRENIRDFFNMVELNTVIPECEHHIKHVPPWLGAYTLDPRTLEPVPQGEVGLLALIDPTPTSYPGFILTDDFARLTPASSCPCGAKGNALEIIRRVHKVEARGCALKIDRKYVSGSRSAQPSV